MSADRELEAWKARALGAEARADALARENEGLREGWRDLARRCERGRGALAAGAALLTGRRDYEQAKPFIKNLDEILETFAGIAADVLAGRP